MCSRCAEKSWKNKTRLGRFRVKKCWEWVIFFHFFKFECIFGLWFLKIEFTYHPEQNLRVSCCITHWLKLDIISWFSSNAEDIRSSVCFTIYFLKSSITNATGCVSVTWHFLFQNVHYQWKFTFHNVFYKKLIICETQCPLRADTVFSDYI